MSAGLIVLVAGVLVAIVCVAFGAVRVVTYGLRLKKRLSGYRRLPILGLAQATQLRLTAAERRIDSVPSLVARVDIAFAEFAMAGARLRAASETAIATIRALPEIFIDNLPALFATTRRTPEN